MTNRMKKKSQQQYLPYRSLSGYLRGIFGRPLRKVPVDPGFGCPNRDGTIGVEGCSFCNIESFVPQTARSGKDPVQQVQDHLKYSPKTKYIIYLQSGTGTHASVEDFRDLVGDLIQMPGNVGLFVGTRPDCVSEEIIDVLTPYMSRKLIWLELGLQTSSDTTLNRIGRGHDVDEFTRARHLAREKGIPVCAHIILGLPGEGHEEMMDTARFLAEHELEGVKIHHLQVIRGTKIEDEYKKGEIVTLDAAEYPILVADFLERLTPRMVIHRLLADAPDDLIIAPRWPTRQKLILSIRDRLHSRGSFQGKLWSP